ncbi:unnamed protein product [Mytilus coruscus]|uniref:Uncharacterized protein n=1 Tax=Mytilus coruscus TaxID=42192 RepID=A0A6J8CIF8_MYTCO|nr:unnamed protein product [Mytilus coruscus]
MWTHSCPMSIKGTCASQKTDSEEILSTCSPVPYHMFSMLYKTFLTMRSCQLWIHRGIGHPRSGQDLWPPQWGNRSTFQPSKADPGSCKGSGSTSHSPYSDPDSSERSISTIHSPCQTKAFSKGGSFTSHSPLTLLAAATMLLLLHHSHPCSLGLGTPAKLKSSSPMDDLYDFFMPDVTMTSIEDHSTTVSSAISHYLPLEPTASTSLSPVTSANLYSTVPTTTTRTYQESSMRLETPMSTTCTSSPDQDPYSPEISPSVQYIFDQDLIQDEDAEYILPQILGFEAPQTSTPKPQPVVQTPPPSLTQPPTPNLNQQILTVLSTFTTTQELLLKEIAHNTKSIQTLSTDIAYLRGQVRQFERVQGRQQTILDRLSNLSNRPFKPIRRKPYLNRPKPQQRQPKVKSVVEKKNDSKEN